MTKNYYSNEKITNNSNSILKETLNNNNNRNSNTNIRNNHNFDKNESIISILLDNGEINSYNINDKKSLLIKHIHYSLYLMFNYISLM